MQLFLSWINLVLMGVAFIVVLSWPRCRAKWFLAAVFGMFVVGDLMQKAIWGLIDSEAALWLINTAWFIPLPVWYTTGHVFLLVGLLMLGNLLRSQSWTLPKASLVALPGRSQEVLRDLMHPVQPGASAIQAHLSLDGAVLNLPCDPGVVDVSRKIRDEVKRRVPAVQWQDDVQGAAIEIRIVEADQGNQFLRWFLPFVLGAAVLEVEGELLVAGHPPQPFHFIRRACISIFGGSARYMIGVCAKRIAGDIAGFLSREGGFRK